MTAELYDIIRFPVITEKSTLLSEHNQVTFRVRTDATKTSVKKAVETLYGVKVASVNTINMQGKNKRFRGIAGTRASYKKAIVSLAKGETIDVMAGVK